MKKLISAIVLLVGGILSMQAYASDACYPAPEGLISWWPGDDEIDIVGQNNGSLVNNVQFQAGMVGDAFYFDGNSYIQAPTTEFPTGSDSRTMELWVKIEQFVPESGEAFFAGYGTFGGGCETFELGSTNFSSTTESTFFFSQWGDAIFSPSLQQNGSWYHVAASNDNGFVTLYINGAPVTSKEFCMATPADSIFYMGAVGEDSFRRLQGLVDEVSVYNRALSQEEIAGIYNAGSAGKCRDEAATSVRIDIKPGRVINRINSKSNGIIPVAILSTRGFDARTVDPFSVKFGPNKALNVGRVQIKDTNRDGKNDLLLHFRTQETGIRCWNTTAFLTGTTFNGNLIQGSDLIKTEGCRISN